MEELQKDNKENLNFKDEIEIMRNRLIIWIFFDFFASDESSSYLYPNSNLAVIKNCRAVDNISFFSFWCQEQKLKWNWQIFRVCFFT